MAASPLAAETLRIATFAAPLSRDGPGLLLRDLRKGDDPQIAATLLAIGQASPDILLLTDFDYDLDARALAAFADLLGTYPYTFATRPNTGLETGLDMDGDGYAGDARDAQGYGRFSGDGGMAILSRFPIGDVRDLSAVLWKDLDGAILPMVDGTVFPSQEAIELQRLSTTGHWIVPIAIPNGPPLTLMAWSATPPVFDGPEDRNGLRNRDELRLWENILRDETPTHFVILGNANLDPADGQGDSAAMAAFLNHPLIQDPKPQSDGAVAAANLTHKGNPAYDTADWDDDIPGNLRVSYVLPSRDWQVTDAGTVWPIGETLAGPHHLVWVDLGW